MEIVKQEIGDVFEELHHSQISYRFEHDWPNGYSWSIIPPKGEGEHLQGITFSLVKAITDMSEAACKVYPKSGFAEWFEAKKELYNS